LLPSLPFVQIPYQYHGIPACIPSLHELPGIKPCIGFVTGMQTDSGCIICYSCHNNEMAVGLSCLKRSEQNDWRRSFVKPVSQVCQVAASYTGLQSLVYRVIGNEIRDGAAERRNMNLVPELFKIDFYTVVTQNHLKAGGSAVVGGLWAEGNIKDCSRRAQRRTTDDEPDDDP
jgi:hypothetical protein